MRRIALFAIAVLMAALSPLAADEANGITFSAGRSSVSLREGARSLSLTEGASVQVDTLSITADSITLEGDNYEMVTCSGSVLIQDESRGITVRASRLTYDRVRERVSVAGWCEVSDTNNSMIASANSLLYDMPNEVMELQMDVRLAADTSSGILSATAESVSYSRDAETLVLSGGAEVTWDGDNYSARAITMDLGDERIRLDGGIGGSVNA